MNTKEIKIDWKEKAFFFFLYTEKQNVTSERKKDTH
jgi:hypothetical protein